MKVILSFGFACAFCATVFGKESVRLTAFSQAFYPPAGVVSPVPIKVHHFDVWLNITNEGTGDLTIPTTGFIAHQVVSGRHLDLEVLFYAALSVEGKPIRLPDNYYSLVVLKPGEATEIKFSTGPMTSDISQIAVTYKIQRELAELHGWRDCELSSDVKDLAAMYMPASK